MLVICIDSHKTSRLKKALNENEKNNFVKHIESLTKLKKLEQSQSDLFKIYCYTFEI